MIPLIGALVSGHVNGLYSQVAAPPGSLSATSVMTVGGGDANDVRMRSFAEIIASEKQQRNILEINLTKLSRSENNTVTKAKPLKFDDLAELVFDVLKIDHICVLVSTTLQEGMTPRKSSSNLVLICHPT
jgi:hypothetical protein